MEQIVSAVGKAMQAVSGPINAVKYGYMKAASWVEAHPHRTIWLSVAAIVLALVLL